MPEIVSSDPEATRTSPVVELRNAVAKLRKHVKHAAESPWVTSSVWSPRATCTSAVYSYHYAPGSIDSEVVASGRIKSGYGGIREPWNAEYIALMQPAVGAAIAEWLEQAIRAQEDGGIAIPAEALTVARRLNGEGGAA